MNRRLVTLGLVGVLALIGAVGEETALPDGRRLSEAVRERIRALPTLLRFDDFSDLAAAGLNFMPGVAAGELERVSGRWPGQEAVRLDRGWLQAEPVQIPDEGLTLVCWLRQNGPGSHTVSGGAGGVVGVGSGWWDGWRLVANPRSGSLEFTLGRPEVGGVSASCRSTLYTGRWHHIAVGWDRRSIFVYVDGELRAETAYDGDYTPSVRQHPFLRIGEFGYGIGTLKVDVAEMALFSGALSAGTIREFARPLLAQSEAIRACMERGDRESRSSQLRFWRGRGGREARARADYDRVLALDPTENPTVLGNYQAIARLRSADSLRREGHLPEAVDAYSALSEDEAVPLHYRAQAMQSRGDAYRDATRYRDARAAYRVMLESFTGRHENFRVEALQRLADVEGLGDGEPFRSARERRIERISRPGREFFIALDGDDTGPGTKAHPFATLERARTAVRGLKAAGTLPDGGVAVSLRRGIYHRTEAFELGEEDSGTVAAPIVYRSYPGELVVLSGGETVAGFRPVTAQDAPGRLADQARPHTLVTDLRAAGVSEFGKLTARGFAIKPEPAHLELVFNGRPMQLARWPNPVGKVVKDFTQVKTLVGEDVRDFHGVPMEMARCFVYADARQDRWAQEPDAWVAGYWHRWYALRYVAITGIDTQKRIVRVGGPEDAYRGIVKGAPYFGINLLCELDTPGEWYLDRDSGLLYFWPPSPIAEGTAGVSLLEEPLLVLDGASHVVFRGLTLEAGRGDAVCIREGEGVLVAACVVRNMGNSGVMIGGSNSGALPLEDLSAGGRNHAVIGCDIYDLGDAGVSLCGGDLKTLTPSGHVVENCHIHHINRWNRAGYQPAVMLDGVGCRASHNLIHDLPHQVVRVRRNDHIFEYNEVHDAPYEAREMGAYYLYGRHRVFGERGNLARYNFFHHVPFTDALGKSFNNARRVIFHIDHMNGGMTVYGNIIWAHEGSAVFTSGGRDNRVENNVFADCELGVSLGDRSFVWTDRTDKQKDRFLAYLRDMNVKQPPWSVRYPQLPELLTHQNPGLPENNVVVRNIGIKVTEFVSISSAQRNHTVRDNWEGGDAGFADAERGDFRLDIADAVVGEIGFDPIPVEQIGLYHDELRATWPVSHEVNTHEHMSIQRRALADMPTYMARPRQAPITIDGMLNPEEWDGLDQSRAIVLANSPADGPATTRRSYVWIVRDETYLYFAAKHPVEPGMPLVTDADCWWRGDMMEIIIEGQIGVNTQGWWIDDTNHGPVFWVLGDCKGDAKSIQQSGLPREPAESLARKLVYAAQQQSGCWTAEWRIPFEAVCLDSANTKACCLNIQVNKAATPVDPSWSKQKRVLAGWAAWTSGGGNVWNAGRLRLR